MKYLAIGSDPKTAKSNAGGEYLTAIMYMRPDIEICPTSALAGCINPCLNLSGRGATDRVQEARQRKTDAYKANPGAFFTQLSTDIAKGITRARKKGLKLAVRLNGTSDIAWENVRNGCGYNLMELYPAVQFYDYTKLPGRKVPGNYYLAVSYSGVNAKYARKVLKSPRALAVVFRTADLPATWEGRPVVNGDADDLIFKHPAGCIIGLKAKGPARKDTSGFVVDHDVLARTV